MSLSVLVGSHLFVSSSCVFLISQLCKPFLDQGKAVFNVEYNLGKTMCNDANAMGLDTIVKVSRKNLPPVSCVFVFSSHFTILSTGRTPGKLPCVGYRTITGTVRNNSSSSSVSTTAVDININTGRTQLAHVWHTQLAHIC